MVFYEQRVFGEWRPAKALERPRVNKQGRVTSSHGQPGPFIRAVKEIHPNHLHHTLDQLQQIYGQDGKFQATLKEGSA